MKLQHLIFGVIASAILYSCGGKQESPITSTKTDTTTVTEKAYTINIDSSVVNWKGEMLSLYSHKGTVKLKGGELLLKGEKISGGIFTIDLKSITPTDSGYTKENTKEKLLGHFASPDFFAVDSFPNATFVIKSVEGNTITGDLTVRGKTNEEKVTDLVVAKNGTDIIASGKIVFDRQKYGVAFKMPVKDKVLSDNIEISVALTGQQN